MRFAPVDLTNRRAHFFSEPDGRHIAPVTTCAARSPQW
jgi:hypothetical protein